MQSLVKFVATLVVMVCSLFALESFVVKPYRCNIAVKRGTTRLLAAVAQPSGSLRAAELARANIDELQSCVADSPSNISADMVLAGSYRVVGNSQRARELYQLALEYDRRPELYFNLGQVQTDIGDSGAGIQNFITACLYDQAYFDQISAEQPQVRSAVRAYLLAHFKRSQ